MFLPVYLGDGASALRPDGEPRCVACEMFDGVERGDIGLRANGERLCDGCWECVEQRERRESECVR